MRPSPISFWKYWKENISEATEGHDMVVTILGLVFFLVSILGGQEWGNYKWIGISLGLAAFLYGILVTPYKRHIQQQEKHSKEVEAYEKQLENRPKKDAVRTMVSNLVLAKGSPKRPG